MPGPAVYVVTVIGVVAVGYAFKEFIYEPHIKPKLEARRRRNTPISVIFTSNRRSSSSGDSDNHNNDHDHNSDDSDDRAKLRDLRNMKDIGELKKDGLFEMETLSWRATSTSTSTSVSASASGVDTGTLRPRNTTATSQSAHRQLDDIFPPMLPSTTTSEQVQSDTERTTSSVITLQPSVPPNNAIDPFTSHDLDIISNPSSISPPISVTGVSEGAGAGAGASVSESILVFRVESDDEEGSLIEADSRPISPFSTSTSTSDLSGSFSQISSSSPSSPSMGNGDGDGDGETHSHSQPQSQSESLSMSQSFSNEYYYTPSQSAYLDHDHDLDLSSPPSPRSPSHDESSWARIGTEDSDSDPDSDTDTDTGSGSGSEEDWVSTGVVSDTGRR